MRKPNQTPGTGPGWNPAVGTLDLEEAEPELPEEVNNSWVSDHVLFWSMSFGKGLSLSGLMDEW